MADELWVLADLGPRDSAVSDSVSSSDDANDGVGSPFWGTISHSSAVVSTAARMGCHLSR